MAGGSTRAGAMGFLPRDAIQAGDFGDLHRGDWERRAGRRRPDVGGARVRCHRRLPGRSDHAARRGAVDRRLAVGARPHPPDGPQPVQRDAGAAHGARHPRRTLHQPDWEEYVVPRLLSHRRVDGAGHQRRARGQYDVQSGHQPSHRLRELHLYAPLRGARHPSPVDYHARDLPADVRLCGAGLSARTAPRRRGRPPATSAR